MTRIGRIEAYRWFFAGLVAVAPMPAPAQDYPARSVRWIVPYPPGGTSDFLARLIGQKLTEAWKQTVIVDNRAGANGNIGTELAAKAPADGYTQLLVASTIAINQSLYKSLPFDAARDFTTVTCVLQQPNLLVVHPSLPVTSVKQLIALGRAKPGALDYASGGSGNANHLGAELFGSMAKVKMNHVPYKGMAPGIAALLGGEVHLTFASLVSVQPHLQSGRLRVLAVTSQARIAPMPDVPTVSEAGVPGYEDVSWVGVLAPAQTPRPVVTRVNQDIVRILKSAEVGEQIRRVGADVIANSPDEFAAMLRSDLKKYAELITTIGTIRLD